MYDASLGAFYDEALYELVADLEEVRDGEIS